MKESLKKHNRKPAPAKAQPAAKPDRAIQMRNLTASAPAQPVAQSQLVKQEQRPGYWSQPRPNSKAVEAELARIINEMK